MLGLLKLRGRGDWVDGVWSWEWNSVRNPRGRTEGEMVELNNILTTVTMSQECRDKWKWKYD